VSSNEDFFVERKAAAVFKHAILSRYPVVFASKAGVGVRGHRVTFLDGYAGRGRYENGEPGSPLLLVESAEKVEAFRTVRGMFVERDPDNFANLSQVLDQRCGANKPLLYPKSLDECLPEILRLTRDEALFAFLDPFGPALDFDLLCSGLLGRPQRPPTEVLLHFSVLSVARLGGALRAARADREELAESDLKSAQRLDRFLGGPWWREHFAAVADERDEGRATDAAMTVADRYRDMVRARTGFMSVSMPVRPRPDLLPKYVLVLFTRHPDGVWYFADTLGKAGLEWQQAWHTEAYNRATDRDVPTLFDLEPVDLFDPKRHAQAHRSEWEATIADNIMRLLDTAGPFRITDHVPQVYGTTLGTAWIPHVREAVRKLHRDGLIGNDGKGDFQYDVIRRP
jgi:three-Cys-motif partner protein